MKKTGSSGAKAEGSTPSLDGQAVLEVVRIRKLDLAGDASADSVAVEFCRMTDADRVHFGLLAEREGNDVAVGGEPLAQPVGELQSLLARAQQNFRRAERAGGKHDGLGIDGRRCSVRVGGRPKGDAPTTCLASRRGSR